jgi:hypothetical protein
MAAREEDYKNVTISPTASEVNPDLRDRYRAGAVNGGLRLSPWAQSPQAKPDHDREKV